MGITLLEGPVIGNLSPGYPRYWTIRREKTTQRRAKPLNLIANPTNYSASQVSTATQPDTHSGTIASPQYGTVGVNPFAYFELIRLVQDLERQAEGRVLQKIKNEKWNLGTFLGELPETQKYLRGVIPRFLEIYRLSVGQIKNPRKWRNLVRRGKRFFKTRKRRGALTASANASSSWLEFRYAVMPLTYDVDDALKYYYDRASRPALCRVSGGAGDSWSSFTRGGTISPAKAVQSAIQVRATCYYSVQQNADALKRLGLINLPAVLWELTPLSFVVDMVLPVGDFLSNLDAMVGVTAVSYTVSRVQTLKEVRSPLSYYTTTWGGSTGSGKFYQRSVKTAPRNYPSFSKSPTGKQLGDLVALTRQILIGSRRAIW